jgi:hypothetical protein
MPFKTCSGDVVVVASARGWHSERCLHRRRSLRVGASKRIPQASRNTRRTEPSHHRGLSHLFLGLRN